MGKFGSRSARTSRDAFETALFDDSSFSKKFDPRSNRKTLQLCRQVERAVMQALAGECDDDLLREVVVDHVEPMGGPGQLLVHVIVPVDVPVIAVMQRLEERSGLLRTIVARSICRKRAPVLSFIAVANLRGGDHVE